MKTIINSTQWGMTLFCVLFSFLMQTNLSAQKNWTGATNDDWNEASNWNPAGVPTIMDDVTIPTTATDPVVKSATSAFAQHITIEPSAVLTIEILAGLSIDNNNNGHGFINNGTVHNYGDIGVNETLNDAIYIGSGGGFTNYSNSNIEIASNGTVLGNGIYNEGTFTVEVNANIKIGNGFGIGRKGIHNKGMFFNSGNITINRTSGTAFHHESTNTLTNQASGSIIIGSLPVVITNDGFISDGTILNRGLLQIDNVSGFGLYHLDGIFNNQPSAQLHIGQFFPIGIHGLFASSSFFNFSPQVTINRTGWGGIVTSNTGGLFFSTTSDVKIGNMVSVAQDGIENGGPFYNNGKISIDNVGGEGIYVRPGVEVNNDTQGEIVIGATGPIDSNGIDNRKTFNNKGKIFLSNIGLDAINNVADGAFENFDGALISIAHADTCHGTGIDNGNVFINQEGGMIDIGANFPVIDKGIINSGNFDNPGAININSRVSLSILNHPTGDFLNETTGAIKIGEVASGTQDGIHTESIFTNKGFISMEQLSGGFPFYADFDFLNELGGVLQIGQ